MKNWCFWAVLLEKTLESPLDCKEIQPVHPKWNQTWTFIGRTDAEGEAPNTLAIWWEEMTHWERPWCWERLKAGEGDNRGWVGWMASQFEQVQEFGSGQPGVLQSIGSQRVGHDWATELNRLKYVPKIAKLYWQKQKKKGLVYNLYIKNHILVAPKLPNWCEVKWTGKNLLESSSK